MPCLALTRGPLLLTPLSPSVGQSVKHLLITSCKGCHETEHRSGCGTKAPEENHSDPRKRACALVLYSAALLPARTRSMLKAAIPVIHVSDSAKAEEFYCRGLGFNLLTSWRPNETNRDPCYMTVARDGAQLHLTSFKDGDVDFDGVCVCGRCGCFVCGVAREGNFDDAATSRSVMGNARNWRSGFGSECDYVWTADCAVGS